MGKVSELVGATPPRGARTVSLAVRNTLLKRSREARGNYGFIVGVSGGADSLALTIAAVDVAERFSIPYSAVIVDHGMRDESGHESEGVAEYLRELGVGHVRVLRPERNGQTQRTEGVARLIRHQALEEFAGSFGNGVGAVDILLGHTMDDQAETVLLRLARGSGNNSLSAMKPVVRVGEGSLSRVRPLLDIRRSDTVAFCEALGLKPVDDPTNRAYGPWRTSEGRPLPRAAVRESVLPRLSESLGQDAVPGLARSAELAARDSAALDSWAHEVLVANLVDGNGVAKFPLKVLAEVPEAVRARVLILLASEVGAGTLSLYHTDALQALVRSRSNASGSSRTVELPNRFEAYRENDEMLIIGRRDLQ